ncbi:DUF724 domain-containing protein 6-like isoform X2 [Chenopodium quinoa]|uniref:DUF724 domain-containing protein 6-like isoform X2 n=1 Tax=Chenopodium quinoa TaxID=63459 RepID=UPI000B77931F|nr:DUF724 domain-containing protein 6-like isoform X2 [Chenopodium quinoa]
MQPKSKTKRLENLRKPPIFIPSSSTSTTSSSLPHFPNPNQIHPFFSLGSQVEVTSDEEGFKGAWYSATVIQPPQSKQKQEQIFVEYKNLLSDENGSSLLKEFVDSEFVRPKPPVDENDKVSFDLDDVVDAFYQDGWWCGVVTCIVSQNRYRVFFSSPPDEIEFDAPDLRIHKNWVHGIWVLPQKQILNFLMEEGSLTNSLGRDLSFFVPHPKLVMDIWSTDLVSSQKVLGDHNRMRDLNFSPGTAVEVNIDPDSPCDVWFPATFIKQAANNLFLVEYQSSKKVGLQKVAVDSDHIRPSPPSSSNKAFNLLEKVDAFYDYRWLSGVVTKILADGRYIVYFKRTKKEKELSHADLRLHMEWSSGKWIHSSQDSSMTSNSEKRSNYIVNGGNKEKTRAPSESAGSDKHFIINLRSCQKELTPGNEKANYSSAAPSSKKTKQTSANGNASYPRPSRKSNDESASDVPLSPETCKSKTQQMEGSSNVTSVDFDSPAPGHPEHSNLKQFEDISQPSYPTEMKVDHEKQSALRKRGRPRVRPLLSGDAVGDTIDQTPNTSDVMKPFGPIVIGLTHNGKMIDTLGESSSQQLILGHKKAVDDEEKNVDSSADHESVGSEQQKEGEVTNQKRKRGRPPKVLFRLGSPQTKEAVPKFVEEEKKDEASDAKDDDERHFPTNEVEKLVTIVDPSGNSDSAPTDFHDKSVRKFTDQIKLLSDIRRLSTRSTLKKQGRKQRKVPTESIMVDSDEPVKPVALRTVLRKGRKQKPTKLVDPQREDVVDNSGIKAIEVYNNVPRESDKAVAGTSSNASDDDRPLSAWFEGAHSPTTDARIPPGGTANESGESGDRGEELKTTPVGLREENEQDNRCTSAENVSQEQYKNFEMPIQSQSTAIVPVESRDLPFVKNSLIWEMIENMEVLKRIPQKPHFLPLYNCKEECREGLAIGSMVTFTSLVERISKSLFSEPKSLLDGYLEALVDLEELGFNVAPVREQLNKMITIKGKYEHAQNTSKEIESQIMERNFEKSQINEEVAEFDKKIAELKEKRALVVSKKERKDAEIALLQTSVDAVKGALANAEEEFEKVTTSLW